MGKVLNWVKKHGDEIAEGVSAVILAGGSAYVWFKVGYKIGYVAGNINGFKLGNVIGMGPIVELMDHLGITPTFDENGMGTFELITDIGEETKARLIEEGYNHIADITFAVK